MGKFFVKSSQIYDNKITIVDEDVNHIKNVLRLNINDKITICDLDSSINYNCEIIEISNEKINCHILEKVDSTTEGNVELHIFQGLPKADKMELIIQKGTELGVSKFIPVKFSRCIVKLSGKDEVKKIDRWNKISEVASKQCGRDIIPEIKDIINIKKLCNLIENYDIVLVAYENEKENTLKEAIKEIKETSKHNKDEIKIGIVIRT